MHVPGRIEDTRTSYDTVAVSCADVLRDALAGEPFQRRDHPDLRLEVGSMTSLDVADRSLTGLLAWFSLIHVPDQSRGTDGRRQLAAMHTAVDVRA